MEDLEPRRLLAATINEFGGSATVLNPAGITTGPDQNLWFTEANPASSAIGRITPSGSITLFTKNLTAGSSPTGITSGSDGALWFTESNTNKIGRIDTSGNISEFDVPTPNSFPDQITAGPDGALWFTEHDGNQIGRIDTSGNFIEYAIPSANSQPVGITLGPDGALWFTESNTDEIGRIDTSGVISEFSAGITKNSSPTGIATGLDGNLWFTELKGNQVARITTAGAVTEFSQGISPGGGPAGIALGADGRLWFTEQNNGKVGAITNLGVVTEYTDPSIRPIDGLAEITSGPDGNLWFTALNGDHVDKITTGGLITQFPSTNAITPSANPVGIAAGPDNALWFTENSANQIGRIDTTGAITEFSQNISSGAMPYGITLGPVPVNGGSPDLWFTEFRTNKIGMITPQGVVTEFLGNPGMGQLEGITLGPDGNLWFAEHAGSPGAGIGQITPSGVVTNFMNGLTNGAAPTSIVTGPDGNLWFTATTTTGGEVGRITTAGAIIEFVVPNNSIAGFTSRPVGITKGLNNDLWFTDPGNHTIDEITTAGVLKEFADGLGSSDVPNQITTGPDGNYWFTDPSNAPDSIGQITQSGSITLFPTPTAGSSPAGITLGPDNNLWFTESTANQIGQVVTSQSIINLTTIPATVPATVPSTFLVATFTDTSTATNAANFAATVFYGDGLSGAGLVLPLPTPGNYQIFATHAYASIGTFMAQVSVGNNAGLQFTPQFTVTTVTPQSLNALSVDGTTGVRSNTRIATFSDLDTTAVVNDFTATVTWSDNTTSPAHLYSVSSTPGSVQFGVYAGHIFSTTGVLTNSITIIDTRNNISTTGSFSVRVGAPASFTPLNEIGPNALMPGAGPNQITLGSDNALWFTETNSGNIGRIDTSGGVTEFVPIHGAFTGSSNSASLPTGITSGPDQNLWFTESAANDIGRVTTAGTFTFFFSGISPGAQPNSITSGPVNTLWFTEIAGNRIGRITTAGNITEFSAGLTAGFNPDSITLGPDGNLWFVGLGSNMIGRITPLGVITEFPGATGQSLTSITTGSDGNLWFTEELTNQIGNINPTTHQVTEFNDPSISHPQNITPGPDGSLWFTGQILSTENIPEVDRITTSGVVTAFTTGLTLNSVPIGITSGPDGNLYFAEAAGDRIGQVILPATSAIVQSSIPPTSTSSAQFSGQIASLVDKSALANSTNFKALIHWGDGSPDDVFNVTSLPNGSLVVNGSHLYQTTGSFNGLITVFNDANDAVPVPFTINVPTSLVVTGAGFNTQAGRSFTGAVASFTDLNGNGSRPASAYQAMINWGDGITSPGTILPSQNGSFLVFGTHTYTTVGSYRTTTTVQLISNPTNSNTGTAQAVVIPFSSNLSADSVAIFATQGNIFVGQVATLFDFTSNSSSPPTVSPYTITIDWGDGTAPTPGTAVPGTGQSFIVNGSHVYTGLGGFRATVQIVLNGQPDTASTSDPVLVEPAGPINEVKLATGSSPFSITSGPDGNLWFTDTGKVAIGRLTTGGVVTEFSSGLPTGVSPRVITSGPDGNLWFTQTGTNAIGRITPQGVITEFSRGISSDAAPDGITTGSDGNLWFTNSAGSIDRITPLGVVTEFRQGLVSGSSPGAITHGPDGNLWFTDEQGPDASEIGRITPQGVITEFTLSTSDAGLTSITTGSDGALWFTEEVAGQIGRITTTGVVNEFSAGLFPGSQPDGITSGPDGNLWFVDFSTNHVDRITTFGVISSFAIPTADSSPLNIVTGPDQNLWFTETATAQIGQVVTPQSVVSTPTTLTANQGVALTTTYATFTDLSSLVNVAKFFSSTINFGDGTFGPASLVSNGSGGDSANATHNYATSGTLQGSATVNNVLGTSAASTLVVNVIPSLTPPNQPLPFVVVNTNDSGVGSLRQAILNADTVAGQTITFAIPGSKVATIVLLSPLPQITNVTNIDGGSQAGYEGLTYQSPLVEIDGRNAGAISPGLVFSGGSAVSFLGRISIFGFAGPQIELNSAGDVLFGNYVGLRADGTVPSLPVGTGDGVLIVAPNAIIGGLDPGQANVISGNSRQGIYLTGPQANSALIVGNVIGLDPTGKSGRGNGINGIAVVQGAGHETIGPGNLISGNTTNGIILLGSVADRIFGNTIGTDRSTSHGIGNGTHGILIDSGSSQVAIGGTFTGSTNVISGNTSVGIVVQGGSNNVSIQFNRVGTEVTGEGAVGNGIAGILISDASNNVVGPGNLVSGNGVLSQGAGVWIEGQGSTGNHVFANAIGTDLDQKSSLGNKVVGILIDDASGNTIGGTFLGSSNLISGNALIGVMIAGTNATGNQVAGNLIGTNIDGSKSIGNGSSTMGSGLYIDNAPSNMIVGNVISGNNFDGVQIFGGASNGNVFQSNKIGTDVNGSKPLGNGDDGLVINGAPGTRIVSNILSANVNNGITINDAGSTNTLIQSNLIGQGANGESLGNGGFGILIINGAPMPTQVGNTNVNNALGPIRDTTVAPPSTTVSNPKTKNVTKGSKSKSLNTVVKKENPTVTIQPKASSFQSRPMPKLQGSSKLRK